MLDRLFGLREHGTTVGREVLAGATTFMVMAYIIFVNPAILSFAGVTGLEGQGPGFGPTLAATCLVAGIMTAVMGLATNYPLAMASDMISRCLPVSIAFCPSGATYSILASMPSGYRPKPTAAMIEVLREVSQRWTSACRTPVAA